MLFSKLMGGIFPAFYTLPFWPPIWRSFGPFVWGMWGTKSQSVIGGAPIVPLIIVVCLFALLYFAYRAKPERVQTTLPWLLFIPIVASISLSVYAIFLNLYDMFVVEGGIGPLGLVDFAGDITFFSYTALFSASFILLFYLTCHYISAEHRKPYTLATGEHLQGLIEEGVGILPARVRVGDSHHIPLDLTFSKDFVERCSHVEDPHASGEYLEAELKGVGLEVDSEKRLRICETSPLPVTTWNCRFSKSGTHTINLFINLVTPPNNLRHLIFMHHDTVKVNSLFSISWAPIVAFITPILVIMMQVLLKLR